jgi:hypothetical protein
MEKDNLHAPKGNETRTDHDNEKRSKEGKTSRIKSNYYVVIYAPNNTLIRLKRIYNF